MIKSIAKVEPTSLLFNILFPENSSFRTDASPAAVACINRAMLHLKGKLNHEFPPHYINPSTRTSFPSTIEGVLISSNMKVG